MTTEPVQFMQALLTKYCGGVFLFVPDFRSWKGFRLFSTSPSQYEYRATSDAAANKLKQRTLKL